MATAQDFASVGEGLDSITRAVLGNYMARRAREQEDEDKRRFEQQRADRLAAEVFMRQDRERMRKLQEDQAAGLAEERKANAEFRTNEAARRNRMEATAALKDKRAAEGQAAYNSARLGSTVSPGMHSVADWLTNPETPIGKGLPELAGQSFTERPMDTSAEGIARAAAVSGVGTPALDEKLAEIAMRHQALTAKAEPKPAPGVVSGNLDIPGFGEVPYTISPTGQTKYWVKGKEKPALSPSAFVTLTKQMESYDKPIQDKEQQILESIGRGNEAERTKLYGELVALRNQRKAVEKFMTSYTGGSGAEFSFDEPAPGASSGAAPAPVSPKPVAKYSLQDMEGVLKTPGAATPPGNSEQDASSKVPPVAVQAPKPSVAPRLKGFAAPVEVPAPPTQQPRITPAQALQRQTDDRVRLITANLEKLAQPTGNSRGQRRPAEWNALRAETLRMVEELAKINPEAAKAFLE